MTEKTKRVLEELTKDCSQEDKALIFQIVDPGEPGKRKKHTKMDIESEQFERIRPILDGVLAAMREDNTSVRNLTKVKRESRAEDLERAAAQEGKYKTKAALFKKQLKEARTFREKRYKYGLELNKLRVLLEIARDIEPWEAITNAFDYGYMVGYKAAQRNARKKAKAAGNKEGEKRA